MTLKKLAIIIGKNILLVGLFVLFGILWYLIFANLEIWSIDTISINSLELLLIGFLGYILVFFLAAKVAIPIHANWPVLILPTLFLGIIIVNSSVNLLKTKESQSEIISSPSMSETNRNCPSASSKNYNDCVLIDSSKQTVQLEYDQNKQDEYANRLSVYDSEGNKTEIELVEQNGICGEAGINSFAVSNNQKYLAYDVSDGKGVSESCPYEIWVVNLENMSKTKIVSGSTKDTNWMHPHPLLWSPDDKDIYLGLSAGIEGIVNLYVVSSTGGLPVDTGIPRLEFFSKDKNYYIYTEGTGSDNGCAKGTDWDCNWCFRNNSLNLYSLITRETKVIDKADNERFQGYGWLPSSSTKFIYSTQQLISGGGCEAQFSDTEYHIYDIETDSIQDIGSWPPDIRTYDETNKTN